MLKITFKWSRDLNGYRLVGDKPARSFTARIKPGVYSIPSGSVIFRLPQPLVDQFGAGEGRRVMSNGGKEQAYFPLEEYEFLVTVFVKDCVDAEGVLKFMTKFGPLTADGKNPKIGESVKFVLFHATAMRRLLDAQRSGDRARLSRSLSGGLSMEASEGATLRIGITMDPGAEEVSFTLTAPDLVSALWLQCYQMIAGGKKFQICEQCGTFFEVGVGSKRRLDAKFCSDAHRVQFNSRNR